MPSVVPYIPSKDADLANWSLNFSTLITANPTLYGLIAGDAVIIAAAQGPWAAAYLVVTSPTTKTAAAVQAKNTAKVVLLQTVRPYAQQVALNAGVAATDKIALGLNPRTSSPTPIAAPSSNPVLVIQSAGNLTVILRYRDSATGVSVKAKPYGVISCEIYGKVSLTPPADPTALPWIRSATKSPFVLALDAADGGKQLYITARWKTRTGLFSSFSPMINLTVPTTV